MYKCTVMAIHEKYKDIDLENIASWQKLSEDIKNSIRYQAKNIPNALLKINYDVVSVKEIEIYVLL